MNPHRDHVPESATQKTMPSLRWRVWVQLGSLAIALGLLVPAWPSDWTCWSVPAVSPLVAVASVVARRGVWSCLVAFPVLVAVLVWPRCFCRYVCPTGFLAERVGRMVRGRRPRGSGVPRVGHWLALLTLGGACLGYPLALWLDPLAAFAGFLNAWGREAVGTMGLAATPLVMMVGLGLVWPGLWCSRLCPLGGLQDMAAIPRRYVERRKQDGLSAGRGWRFTRRAAIALGLGAVGGGALGQWIAGPRPRPLRPPGAAGEAQFTGLCIRCGNCARVCPTRIIHPDLGQFGADSFLTPVIRFVGDAYCRETCRRCTQVCPSGALQPLTANRKAKAVIGLPRIDMTVCLLGEDRECGLCRDACPYHAIRLVFSEEDYLTTPQVLPQLCNGCGACQAVCPTQPKAIVVFPV